MGVCVLQRVRVGCDDCVAGYREVGVMWSLTWGGQRWGSNQAGVLLFFGVGLEFKWARGGLCMFWIRLGLFLVVMDLVYGLK